VRWQELSVPIPRCATCRRSHTWAGHWSTAGLYVGLLLGAVVGLALVLAAKASLAILVLALALIPAGAFAGSRGVRWLVERRARRGGIAPWRHGDAFPAVAAQLQQGWRSGKPFGTRG
jgi:hypothetical protein